MWDDVSIGMLAQCVQRQGRILVFLECLGREGASLVLFDDFWSRRHDRSTERLRVGILQSGILSRLQWPLLQQQLLL